VRTLVSVAQFVERNPAWTQAAIRNLIHEAKDRVTSRGHVEGNGLQPAIIRFGRRVLLDEPLFLAIVAGDRPHAAEAVPPRGQATRSRSSGPAENRRKGVQVTARKKRGTAR
jgi:hypothetical protein